MLKKISLPLLVLLAALLLIPTPKAAAAVRFGVYIGGPAYARPVYRSPYVYPYAAPAYVYPYSYWGGRRGPEWRARGYRGRYRGYRR